MLILLLSILLLVGLVPILSEVLRGRFDAFNAKNAFIAYYLMQLAAPAANIAFGGEVSPIALDPHFYEDYYLLTLALAIFGLLAFHLGYYATNGPRLPARLLAAQWSRPRVNFVIALFVLGGLSALASFLSLYGGDAAAARAAWRGGELQGQGLITFAAGSLPALGVMLWMVSRKNLRFGWRFLLVAGMALLPAIFMGFRSLFMLPILQFMVVWHFWRRPLPIKRLAVLLVFAGAVFTGYGIWRTIPEGYDLSDGVARVLQTEPELLYNIAMRSRGTEIVATVLKAMDQDRIEYRMVVPFIWEAATIYVPSGLWPDKPTPSSLTFGTEFFGQDLSILRGDFTTVLFGGISPTAIGEFYWQLGWLGVFGGMLVLGIIAKRAYRLVSTHRDKPAVVVGYGIFFTALMGMAEAPQGYTNGLVLWGITFFGVLIFICKRRTAMPQRYEQTGTPQR